MQGKSPDEEKLERLYQFFRIVIYAIPALIVIVGLYVVLFPVDDFRYSPNQPELSKFELEKNSDTNEINFGVFPMNDYRFADLLVSFKQTDDSSCLSGDAEVTLEKTYQAFLFPEGETINDEETLKNYLFEGNNTKYPNGSLLHSKATDEVFFISRGKRILFPGPEIFLAFGYNFENLIDVDNSALDQLPEARQRVMLWTSPHPDGTIFQAFPSHKMYLTFEGKKYPIASKELLDRVWREKNYLIPVSDPDPANRLLCLVAQKQLEKQRLICSFDNENMPPTLGKYYYFTAKYPRGCDVDDLSFSSGEINLASDKSLATAKNSVNNIVASMLSRYVYKN